MARRVSCKKAKQMICSILNHEGFCDFGYHSLLNASLFKKNGDRAYQAESYKLRRFGMPYSFEGGK